MIESGCSWVGQQEQGNRNPPSFKHVLEEISTLFHSAKGAKAPFLPMSVANIHLLDFLEQGFREKGGSCMVQSW